MRSLQPPQSSSLPPALSAVADYLEQHPLDLVILTPRELAARCLVSDTAIGRYVKLSGYETYQEMRAAARQRIVDSEPVVEAATRKMKIVARRHNPDDWQRRIAASVRAVVKAKNEDMLVDALIRVAAESLAVASRVSENGTYEVNDV